MNHHVLNFKVTAFIPANVVRGGGNFGMLLVVENTSNESIANVAVTAGERSWGEGEEIGSIPAGEARRATLNLKLKDSGDWVIPIWVGCYEESVDGWKGVLTTGVDPDKDYGVKEITIVGQQISGEKAGMGSVNEVEMKLGELASLLDPTTREQIHKGQLVPVPVQLERRDPHLWQKHLNIMKRSEESRPAPANQTVNVNINNPYADREDHSSKQKESMWHRHPLLYALAVGLPAAVLVVVGNHYKTDEGTVDRDPIPQERTADGSGITNIDDHDSRGNPVAPSVPEKKRNSEPKVQALSLKIGKSEYQAGESFSFEVRIPSDGFLYVFAHWADDTHFLIYPTEKYPESRVKAGQVLRIPQDIGEAMTMHFPPGIIGNAAREDITAILAQKRLDIPVDTQRDLSAEIVEQGLISRKDLFMNRGPRVSKSLHWAEAESWQSDTRHYLIRK